MRKITLIIIISSMLMVGCEVVPNRVASILSTPGLTSTFQGNISRYVEKEGGFSYIPPNGWQIEELNPLPFKIVEIASKSEIYPYISFSVEINMLSLTEYSQKIIDDFINAQQATSVQILKNEEVLFDNGIKGIRLEITDIQDGNKLFQEDYFLEQKEKKIIGIYTRVQDKDQDKDFAAENCLKTIQFED